MAHAKNGLTSYRDKSHVDYINAYYKIFRSLTAYVKQYFPTGITWNQKDGVDCLQALQQIQSGAATPKASAQPTSSGPPPPPPPPLPVFDDNGVPSAPPPPPGSNSTGGGGDMSAVFAQLNTGSAITSSLRKVDKSEMTHKNPSLRASGTVPERKSSQTSNSSRGKSPLPNKKPDSMRTKKPGKKELDGNKWIVENFENTGNELIEIHAELNHSILISKCNKCTIKVHNKANAISIDNCSSFNILIDSLVSSLDVIKTPKFAVQVDGKVPTIMLDQVDGATVYLSTESLGTEVFTSKCSAVNLVVPPSDEEGGEEGDSKECPVPEQIRSVVKGGKVVSEVVEHAG
jgi:adenylyl cyclase-associated protein